MVLQKGIKQTTPDGWREVLLRDTPDFPSGGTSSKSRNDYWNGSVPWVSTKDTKHLRFICSTNTD